MRVFGRLKGVGVLGFRISGLGFEGGFMGFQGLRVV